ncbi:uncharacterized protein GLRG_10210 [Colletotrichum graminicola M1.001]|uniref:Uncharacterized protein n=1 Tax=Colletotrichum graminicola (strain M1.001 / M2 / FGSC 10212) TaxID=645133 RepID=E3QW28_COLGM|nr:uncharacterized protein GLRG_10210 [Colletotrichum graminicola M1.001]EFQ35066.1 hypothetical protein GLRG_10210 [Colletotrichum graminicola M1.001]
MSTDYGAVAEKRSQRRAPEGDATLETSSSNINPATKTLRVPRSSMTRPTETGTPLAGSRDGQRASKDRMCESIAKDSITASIPSSRSRSFDSLPYVRTNRLPPMQLKTAPSALRSASASKRKRGSSAESSSGLSSSDEIGGSEKGALPRMLESNTIYGEARTTAEAPTTSQRSLGVSNIYSEVSQTQSRRNRPSMLRTRVAHSPIVLSSSGYDVDGNEDGAYNIGSTSQVTPLNRQSHRTIIPADRAYLKNANLPSITGGVDHQKMAPDQQRGKTNCEERRLQLCATFNSAKFDAMIYGQAEATSPPEGVFVPVAPSNMLTNVQFSGESREQLYMRLDPRIHWPHNRSDHWYRAKMEEIKSRGGRKANFGRAAQRMRQQRLETERLDKEEKRAAEQGLPVLHNKPPQPWSHHRPMDFGDVPEEELPAYVRKNPEWLQATAWMRENREKNLHRNKEAAALRAACLPCDHLFPRSGR